MFLSNHVFSYLLCISTVAGGAVCICPISIIQGLLDPLLCGDPPSLLPSSYSRHLSNDEDHDDYYHDNGEDDHDHDEKKI